MVLRHFVRWIVIKLFEYLACGEFFFREESVKENKLQTNLIYFYMEINFLKKKSIRENKT